LATAQTHERRRLDQTSDAPALPRRHRLARRAKRIWPDPVRSRRWPGSPHDGRECYGTSEGTGPPRTGSPSIAREDILWIRSFALGEEDGSVGTVCTYQASSPEAIRKQAEVAELPVDEVIPVADTIVVRPDPEPAST